MSTAILFERSSDNAQGTDVSGLISINTTWNITGSPYIVIDNVTVDTGVTLTIEGGVEVRFDGPFDLNVNGSLHAVGNPTSRINFTSNSGSPCPGDWDRIHVNPGGNVTIAFADIYYSTEGVFLNESSGNSISDNRFMYNFGMGIMVLNSSNNDIMYNNISHNKDGIYLEFSHNNSITNNTFFDNTLYGIYTLASSMASVFGQAPRTTPWLTIQFPRTPGAGSMWRHRGTTPFLAIWWSRTMWGYTSGLRQHTMKYPITRFF
jgi:parallel beta-helix repeat protein